MSVNFEKVSPSPFNKTEHSGIYVFGELIGVTDKIGSFVTIGQFNNTPTTHNAQMIRLRKDDLFFSNSAFMGKNNEYKEFDKFVENSFKIDERDDGSVELTFSENGQQTGHYVFKNSTDVSQYK